jgi:hypothetical protein
MTAESIVDFVLAVFATWRVSFLLTQEDGPWDVFARLRRVAGDSMAGRALQCLYCTSLWVAIPAALFAAPASDRISVRTGVTWLAISGAACLLHRATERSHGFPTLDILPLDERPPDETR